MGHRPSALVPIKGGVISRGERGILRPLPTREDQTCAHISQALKEGVTLIGVEVQAEKYTRAFPLIYPPLSDHCHLLYQSTGVETRFTNGLDPQPRSRPVFSFHRPDTLAALIPDNNEAPRNLHGASLAAETATTLRARLRRLSMTSKLRWNSSV